MTESEWQKLSISTIHKNKPLFKVLELAKVIKEIDANVFCLQEVITKQSLLNFNKYFLNNEYNVVLEESNSNRSIYVGFLIKKGISYDIESYSHRRLSNGGFASRNLTSIVVKDATGPLFVVLGVHLKSKRLDEKRLNTYDVRELEVALLSEIHKDIKGKYPCPVLICGDMNANFNIEPEFHHLAKSGFVDFVKVKHGSSYESVGTFTTNYLETKVQQLDFILLGNEHFGKVDIIESGIYLYKNEYNDSITLPFNKKEREYLPSDHCPIFIKFSLD